MRLQEYHTGQTRGRSPLRRCLSAIPSAVWDHFSGYGMWWWCSGAGAWKGKSAFLRSSIPPPQGGNASLLHVDKIKIKLRAIIGRLRALPHMLRFRPGRAFIDGHWRRGRVFALHGVLQAIVTVRLSFIALEPHVRAIQTNLSTLDSPGAEEIR